MQNAEGPMRPAAFLIIQKGKPKHPLAAMLPHRAQNLRGDEYEAIPLYTREQARQMALEPNTQEEPSR